MEKDQYIEKLLNEFVFVDSRLGNHPKVRASVLWRDGERLVLAERAPNIAPLPPSKYLLVSPRKNNVAWHVLQERAYTLVLDVDDDVFGPWPDKYPPDRSTPYNSILAVPLLYGEDAIGVLSFDSVEPEYFQEKHLGIAQLLSALLAYTKVRAEIITPASIALGRALKNVREELSLTQEELAERIKRGRIALSRWERGAQPPSREVLYEWCLALGLFSPTKNTLVTTVDITARLLELLKADPYHLHQLSPSQFEQFVAERLDRMGFDVTLTGPTSHKDGGIDLIAVPKVRTVGAFLLAGQIKHRIAERKTGREAVDRLLAWKDSQFRLGLLVTNTAFTKDARWFAEQDSNRSFIRLRDFADIKRWLEDNFWSEEDWREIPNEINLAPGVTITIPKPRLEGSLSIWPLSKLDSP